MESRNDGHVLVLVEDDAGDTFLVAEMLRYAAPNVTLACFTSLASALAGWPPEAQCALLDLGLPDAFGPDAVIHATSQHHNGDIRHARAQMVEGIELPLYGNVSFTERHTYWTSPVDPPPGSAKPKAKSS